ncbi:prolyl oligopeptidase family serine peptidase [Streptomyces sp. NPDC087844]|uniref:prolyl oligopeptidase family serine peptidase n=1 Tax=Streptomyces sp. NPDC087844 TaxID=3365805 RepID=UPI0038022809
MRRCWSVSPASTASAGLRRGTHGPLRTLGHRPHLAEEFGTASDPEHLAWLLRYSAYHHVRPNTAYPAVLLAGAVTDERTGDAHPRKTYAALQHSNPHGKPVRLRRQPDSGHGPTDNTTALQALTDILTFLATRTGLRPAT